MAIKFTCGFYPLKLLIFMLVITYFGTPPDCTRYAMILAFSSNLTFLKDFFEECLSDIYLT